MALVNNNILPGREYIIDANINRFKEGARVIEDIARFVLREQKLFIKIRNLRHAITLENIYRSSNDDLGGSNFKESNLRESLLDIANANCIRMQEAARVLEEISCKKYKSIRFSSYQIHHQIISSLKIFLNIDKLSGLYLLCDLEVNSIQKISSVINNSRISVCQIRSKNISKSKLLDSIKQLKKLINRKILLIINDHIEIALAVGHGVHLGQNDLPLETAIKLSPENFIIGISCHNIKEALAAQKNRASYISVGCLFATNTKINTIPTTLETLKNIVSTVDIPVCAIGGINHTNLELILQHRPNMVACYSSIWNNGDPLTNINSLSKHFTNLK